MKVEHLSKEEKLNLIYLSLIDSIEKTETEFNIKLVNKESKNSNFKNEIQNAIILDKVTSFYIKNSNPELMGVSTHYCQEVIIQMSISRSINDVLYVVHLFYEPNMERVSEIINIYRSTSVVEEE